MYKLKQNRISGKLSNIIKDFLHSRKQRVVLNGQHSFWTLLLFILGQYYSRGLFIIYLFSYLICYLTSMFTIDKKN